MLKIGELVRSGPLVRNDAVKRGNRVGLDYFS